MIGDEEDGGLRMPNFKSIVKAQKVMWIKRLLDNEPRKWKTISFKLMKLSKSDLLYKNTIEYIPKQCSPFYAQILTYWFELYSTDPAPEYVSHEILWYNKFIRIGNKSITKTHKHWQKKRIETCLI